MNNNSQKKCGFVAITGRPNVGKSTLINHLISKQITITSNKAQTSRHRVCGVITAVDYQIIFTDNPGFSTKVVANKMNELLNNVAINSVKEDDITLLVLEACSWTNAEQTLLNIIKKIKSQLIIAISKVDKYKAETIKLEQFVNFTKIKLIELGFKDIPIIKISSIAKYNLTELTKTIVKKLPEQDFFLFPSNQITDKNDNFLFAELIREQIFRQVGAEIPYSITTVIDEIKQDNNIYHITATIFIERHSHKKIIIGKNGQRIKKIGSLARKKMENILEQKVMLKLWVKVKSNWTKSEKLLKDFGYIV